MTKITLTTPYRCEAIIELAEDGLPFVAAVNSVELPFDGELVDVTMQVLMSTQLFAKLSKRLLDEYSWAVSKKVMKTHAETLKKLGEA